RQKPFLLTMSYLEVHHQNDLDVFQPPKKYANQFRNPFVPQDLRPLPGTWPSQLADYYGCVKGIDDEVGTLLKTLREENIEDNTIVVFVSDHGCHFKTRNAEYKRSPHDSSIHVPLIIQGPGFDRSLEISECVSHVNLAPSLLDATKTPIPASMQGKSFLPLLERKTEGWQNRCTSACANSSPGVFCGHPNGRTRSRRPSVRAGKPPSAPIRTWNTCSTTI